MARDGSWAFRWLFLKSWRCVLTGSLWLRARGLREPRRIDVVYRRTDADRLRLRHRAVAGGRFWAAGGCGLVNMYGTGIADDKLTHAYVEDMIRFYVGEEPVLRSVPPYDLSRPSQLEEALDVFDTLVLKPRAGHGGVGVLIAPLASRAEVEATREAVIASPGDWIAQRMVMLSTHPTVVEGGRLGPTAHRPPSVRLFGRGLQPARVARRPDPRRPLRGRTRRQFLSERRRERLTWVLP